MKVDIIKKFKWYIVGFILVAIMLSVSLSFCTWDNLSAKAGINVNSGKYSETPVVGLGNILLVDDKYLADGSLGVNGSVDIGDIVTYGNFYQEGDAVITGVTTPLRWIVVDYNITTKIAILFTEQAVVNGNFWGSVYSNFPNYYQSTVRSWLNSGKGSLKGNGTNWKDSERYDDNVRNDNIGSKFGIYENRVNKGFLDVAFTDDEKSILISKKIANMKYNDSISCLTSGTDSPNNNEINDLVWLPSWKEIYGNISQPWGASMDDAKDVHFKYFTTDSDNSRKIAGATAYAWNAASSSYYDNGGGYVDDTQTNVWWWLRTSRAKSSTSLLHVYQNGSAGSANSGYIGAVRPAVCVQL